MLFASGSTDSVAAWHNPCGGSAHKASGFISCTANDVLPIKSTQWSQQRICTNKENQSDREAESGDEREAVWKESRALHKIYSKNEDSK